mmetsp:Transcript_59533/g.98108  ORF Transcript_59533/g.98108 Transcript_59533/m.98108 type:complete len:222 (-) Transcript_59533:2127-2792(-)
MCMDMLRDITDDHCVGRALPTATGRHRPPSPVGCAMAWRRLEGRALCTERLPYNSSGSHGPSSGSAHDDHARCVRQRQFPGLQRRCRSQLLGRRAALPRLVLRFVAVATSRVVPPDVWCPQVRTAFVLCPKAAMRPYCPSDGENRPSVIGWACQHGRPPCGLDGRDRCRSVPSPGHSRGAVCHLGPANTACGTARRGGRCAYSLPCAAQRRLGLGCHAVKS